MYGWNYVCMDETYVLDISYVCCETCLLKYIYIYHIFAVKCLDIRKNRIKRGNAATLPSATDGKELFAVCSRRQSGHVAATCATWEHWGLTHLVTLPSMAYGKGLAGADGKEVAG